MSEYAVYPHGDRWCVKKDLIFHIPPIVETESQAIALKATLDRETGLLKQELACVCTANKDFYDMAIRLQAEIDAQKKANAHLQADAKPHNQDMLAQVGLYKLVLDENKILQKQLDSEPTTADSLNEDIPIKHTGAIASYCKITTKQGEQMAIIILDTSVEIVVYPKILSHNKVTLEGFNTTKETTVFNCSIISDGTRTDTILLSVGETFEQYLERVAERHAMEIQHQLDMNALHEYHVNRKTSHEYALDCEDNTWYIVKRNGTLANDYADNIHDAIEICNRMNTVKGVVEKPIVHSDSYKSVNTHEKIISSDDSVFIQCNVCGKTSMCDVV